MMIPSNSALMFDIAIDVQEENHLAPPQMSDAWVSVRAITSPTTRFQSRLLDDVRYYKRALLREEGQVDIVLLASRLATVGYRVAIRRAVGGGRGQHCFRNLCYEFLLVSSPDANAVQHVVDPKFREQFAISQSTREYEMLLSLVPSEFVGTPSRLKPLVKLLCLEMEQTFQEKGLTWPPWRQAESMISKWLPTKSRDTHVASPASSPKASEVEGSSPTGPLSFCSSLSSSMGSDSPDRLHDICNYTTQMKPKRIQTGFCPAEPLQAAPPKLSLPGKPAKLQSQSSQLLLRASSLRQERREEADLAWQPHIRKVRMSGAS